MFEINAVSGQVLAVSLNADHTFSKTNVETIMLAKGLGVEGDVHLGKTVQHRYIKEKDPDRYNRRQVLLIAWERVKEWQEKGHCVWPGALGENITTKGIVLETLPRNTRLRFKKGGQILLTGLRKPCHQIESFSQGLLAETISKDLDKNPRFSAGVMAIVESSGPVSIGDRIEIFLPAKPFVRMGAV